MDQYLKSRSIPYNRCGKLIVATTIEELIELEILEQKAISNGVINLKRLSKEDVKYLEPKVFCLGALFSPSTSIFDSHSFMSSILNDAECNGLITVYNCEVLNVSYQSFQPQFTINTNQGSIQCDIFINSCGLNAPKINYFLSNNNQPLLQINDRIPTPYFLKGNYFKYSGNILILLS